MNEAARSELTQRLLALVAAELGVEIEEVAERVRTLGSIERMQLAVAVEDHFRIRLGAEDEARLLSIEEVACLIEERLADAIDARSG